MHTEEHRTQHVVSDGCSSCHQAAGQEVDQARDASEPGPAPRSNEEVSAAVHEGDGIKATAEDAGTAGVRAQLATAANLAAAQLARELNDALRRHAAGVKVRHPAPALHDAQAFTVLTLFASQITGGFSILLVARSTPHQG